MFRSGGSFRVGDICLSGADNSDPRGFFCYRPVDNLFWVFVIAGLVTLTTEEKHMKRMSLLRWTLVVAAAIACVGLFLGPASAEKKKKTRICSTHDLMEGLVAPNCKALGGELKKDKTNFKAIAMRASLLNESGHVLMDGGRCPDKVWENATKALRENGAAIVASAKAKDLDAVKASFKKLTTNGCGACHKMHKK